MKNIFKIIFAVYLILFSTTFLQARKGKGYSKNLELVFRKLKRKKYYAPSKSILQKIDKYDRYIKYFASLSYTRYGFNVNPDYIRALIAAESAGDPRAVSKDGAIGLTQIMYASAKTYVKELAETKFNFKYIDEKKLRNFKKQYLYDPAINILLCAYITDLNNGKFGGNLATTVAAWNAGQYAVYKYEGIPPYDETLTLITKVSDYLEYFQSN